MFTAVVNDILKVKYNYHILEWLKELNVHVL